MCLRLGKQYDLKDPLCAFDFLRGRIRKRILLRKRLLWLFHDSSCFSNFCRLNIVSEIEVGSSYDNLPSDTRGHIHTPGKSSQEILGTQPVDFLYAIPGGGNYLLHY